MTLCCKYLVSVCFSIVSACLHLAAGQNYCQLNHWSDGVHTHPTHCDRYVMCDNLQTSIVLCPSGFLFDPGFRACRYAASVTGNCDDPVTTSATVTTEVGNICQEKKWDDGLYPDPYDCSKFIECTFLHTNILSCPSGHSFDPVHKTCMLQQDAPPCLNQGPVVGRREMLLAPSVSAELNNICVHHSLPTGIYPHPDRCDLYLQCQGTDSPLQLSCDGGMIFNSHSRVCDVVNNVDCSDNYRFYSHIN